MPGRRPNRFLYAFFTPLRWCFEWLDWFWFWHRYARIKKRRLKPEGQLFPAEVRELIANAETIEVFSLGGYAESDPDAFHGWRVIGRTPIEDARTRRLLAERLLIANEASDRGWKCIDGEYGIRITAGSETLDLMICFACGNAWAYGRVHGMGNICSTPVGYLLDRILRRANVTLPVPGMAHAG
jgi:hypothetical protein